MVLLISTSASAAVQIAVNGVMNPPEITLDPFQTASISVWTDAVMNTPAWYVLGITEGEPGTLYGDPWSGDPHILIYPPEPEPPFPGFSSWVMFSYDGMVPVPPGSMLVDNITFHCDGPGNVNMLLLGTEDFSSAWLAEAQMIHQTPEPGTIALLGLGAILLKRRR